MSNAISYEYGNNATNYSGLLSAACLATIFASHMPLQAGIAGVTPPNANRNEITLLSGGNRATFDYFSSPISGEFLSSPPVDILEAKVTQFYSNLLGTQEPLGAKFEAVLYDNLWDLYLR